MMIDTMTRLYSVRDVAQALSVNPSRIRRLIGHGRIPDARYVGSSWAIPAGAVILPDPETKLSPAETYAKHGGNITKYIALCEERGVSARIPIYEWFAAELDPPRPHNKLTREDVDEMRHLREARGMSYSQLAELYNVHYNTVRNAMTGKSWSEPEPCIICSGRGKIIAENEQFGPFTFDCRECEGSGKAPRE